MSARLSPAASLLRHSKLFALPPAVPLPPEPPSSDVVAHSDTATTVYPTHAAIETPSIALSRGDWGFKRALPLKATTKSGNPSVRLVRGIDTPEHVADFESAADHVLTLRKFQELSHPLRLPEQATRTYDRRDFSVFRASHDNTTNTSSTAPASGQATGVWPNLMTAGLPQQVPDHIADKSVEVQELKKADGTSAIAAATDDDTKIPSKRMEQRRWRYAGPSLLKITGMDFDHFLKTLGPEHKAKLRDRAKQELLRERTESARVEGEMDTISTSVTEEDLSDYMRTLRAEPRKFGPLIAEVLDLPEGQAPPVRRPGESDPWEYGRDTLASGVWRERGPPRTHPSGGLSYVHTATISNNHPKYGPQKNRPAVLARAVKHRLRSGPSRAEFAVAGFIVPPPQVAGVNTNLDMQDSLETGLKAPVIPGPASFTEEGALRMAVTRSGEYTIKDDKAVHRVEARDEMEERGELEGNALQSAPRFSRPNPTRRAIETRKREVIEPSQDVDDVLKEMMEFRKVETGKMNRPMTQ